MKRKLYSYAKVDTRYNNVTAILISAVNYVNPRSHVDLFWHQIETYNLDKVVNLTPSFKRGFISSSMLCLQ